MTTIPLRVCKAISIHKCQGISVGQGEQWTKIVVMLPGITSRMRQPGLECVACSRAKEIADMAFIENEKNLLTYEKLLKIGTTPAYIDRRNFEHRRLDQHIQRTKQVVTELITQQDVTDEVFTEKTFNGGYCKLLEWYNERALERQNGENTD